MRVHRTGLCVASVLVFNILAQAVPYAVFPKAGQLPSPDGRFVVRNIDPVAPASEYVGTFHSLFLEDTASGRTRKLCDYVGVAALAWTRNNSLIMTEYLSKHTSRVRIFSADEARDPVVIDQSLLTRLVPVDLRPQIRENDHVFVEASQIEGQMLTLGVWGYGRHDANGFRWRCQYSLLEGSISCQETPASK
ncbi:MAG TPA: hypothetical protein VKF84_17940 [Candidatus Sulfotelmatobacter sp.]|nr:hypothetical protein [Candidatus Sulfotelmatobacter sp.]